MQPFRLATREDWKRIVEYIKTLPWTRDDKRLMYRITIEEMKPKRSLEQNARYFALLTAISKQAPDYMGGEYHNHEVWHAYLAERFLGVEPGPFGTGIRKSTKSLRVSEFSQYMDEIEEWARDRFAGFTFDYEERAAA